MTKIEKNRREFEELVALLSPVNLREAGEDLRFEKTDRAVIARAGEILAEPSHRYSREAHDSLIQAAQRLRAIAFLTFSLPGLRQFQEPRLAEIPSLAPPETRATMTVHKKRPALKTGVRSFSWHENSSTDQTFPPHEKRV